MVVKANSIISDVAPDYSVKADLEEMKTKTPIQDA